MVFTVVFVHTSSHEQHQSVASVKTFGTMDKYQPCLSNCKPQGHCHILHILPSINKIHEPFSPIPDSYLSFLDYTVILKGTGTVSLTWLMKRLLRFSLTVKTKDATKMLHDCMPTPYRSPTTSPLCVIPSFHQPTYPVAPLPNIRICNLQRSESS